MATRQMRARATVTIDEPMPPRYSPTIRPKKLLPYRTLPVRATVSAMAAIVNMLIKPRVTKRTMPGIGPTIATAMGSAMMPAPTVSVSVNENTAQKGGRDSSHDDAADCAQRSRSSREISG